MKYGKLWLENGFWQITCEPHVLLHLKRVIGRVGKDASGQISLSNTAENCHDLQWFCLRFPLSIATADQEKLDTGAQRHKDIILRLEQMIDPNYQPPTFDLAKPLRDYQARNTALYLTQGFLLVGDDVGLGKTAVAIASFREPGTLPALVVTLTHLPPQWAYEINTFAPDLRVHIIKRGRPYELPKFMGRGPDVVIINYHKLSGWVDVLREYCKSIAFDEIQELRHDESSKGFKTQKYAAAEAIAHALPYRVGLSATPIHNYGGEMYNILHVLKPGALGTRPEFETEWCLWGGRGAKLKDPKAFGSYLRSNFLMVRHTRKEVGRELPDVIKITHAIDADKAALDKVEFSAAELAHVILKRGESEKGEKLRASEEFSNILRQATGIAKAPYVAEFVRMLVESGEKVLLAGWHRAVYDIWLSKLKDLRPVMYTGSESPTQKEQSKRQFTSTSEYGSSPIMIISLRSGAGMNDLQNVCSCVVFGELDWSPAIHEQVIGRLQRDGQKDPVVAYFLVAEDGADPVIAETLGLKRDQLEGIRNPDQDLIERLETGGDRTRKLAEHYLKRIGQPLPADEPEEVAQ